MERMEHILERYSKAAQESTTRLQLAQCRPAKTSLPVKNLNGEGIINSNLKPRTRSRQQKSQEP
jgi:hypothetical protein